MKDNYRYLIYLISVFFIGITFGILLRQNKTTWNFIKKKLYEPYIKFDDTKISHWDKEFIVVDIKSKLDDNIQKAYWYKSESSNPKPLIVSLHTWSGNYSQKDRLANICKQYDLNYIHPDFRGGNWTKNACCSELALNDIDEAITFVIENSNVDTTKIFVIGVSGGGYATLCSFMKSKHKIKKFSAWASISDLIAWYHESNIRNSIFADNIINCTASENELNVENAKKKSPIYWNTPTEKLTNSKLFIYAGIYDGIRGSVPITHSINFYNKLLRDLSVSDTSKYISLNEKIKLLEIRKPLAELGTVGGRKICLKKEVGNVSIIIFEGKHEMLTEYAFHQLLEE